ncbi:MAG: riboflavin synthase [Bacteroidetes bacterium]|nr:MAG: riboflavin synthase [Bacteroidota bacterium]
MFTGIVEQQGKVTAIETEGNNVHFFVEAPMTKELQVDQSVSHNGVCLTTVDIDKDVYKVTAVDETLKKSNLGDLKPGDYVNLERSMVSNGRFDGHIVQGHVDETAICSEITEEDGSWLFTFKLAKPTNLMVEKGSVSINGISLTCFDVTSQQFTCAIIPYTFEHTNFGTLKAGDKVNIEFDIVGKYVAKMLEAQQQPV